MWRKKTYLGFKQAMKILDTPLQAGGNSPDSKVLMLATVRFIGAKVAMDAVAESLERKNYWLGKASEWHLIRDRHLCQKFAKNENALLSAKEKYFALSNEYAAILVPNFMASGSGVENYGDSTLLAILNSPVSINGGEMAGIKLARLNLHARFDAFNVFALKRIGKAVCDFPGLELSDILESGFKLYASIGIAAHLLKDSELPIEEARLLLKERAREMCYSYPLQTDKLWKLINPQEDVSYAAIKQLAWPDQ